MKIAMLIIATGKYWQFVPPLIESTQFLLKGYDKRFIIHTDEPESDVWEDIDFACDPYNAVFCSHNHEPWPGPTLHRYRTFIASYDQWKDCDYAFYIDADMRFENPVGDEILGTGLTATIHPGFAGKPLNQLSYCRNPRSTAFVKPNEGQRYYCGGFQGGTTASYYAAMRMMAHNIAKDEENGVMAEWHDESHWNRHLIDHPPSVVLDPSYCSPEEWNVADRRLVALKKNHAEVRS